MDGNKIIGVLLLCMITWTCFYILVAWYVERIFPGDYGVKLPYHFPFMVRRKFNTKVEKI